MGNPRCAKVIRANSSLNKTISVSSIIVMILFCCLLFVLLSRCIPSAFMRI